jgi:hypothetical protein
MTQPILSLGAGHERRPPVSRVGDEQSGTWPGSAMTLATRTLQHRWTLVFVAVLACEVDSWSQGQGKSNSNILCRYSSERGQHVHNWSHWSTYPGRSDQYSCKRGRGAQNLIVRTTLVRSQILPTRPRACRKRKKLLGARNVDIILRRAQVVRWMKRR